MIQVIDGVINKVYDQDFDGAKVFADYETGLYTLLGALTEASPGEHFDLPKKDISKLTQASSPGLLFMKLCCSVMCRASCALLLFVVQHCVMQCNA